MKIQVKELGAIKEGTVDLSKKLIVFCGPNGTGKTYMAYAIYGLLKSQIHIRKKNDIANDLIEKRKINYQIDFNELSLYRKNIIDNIKTEYDSLFGIGQDLAKQYFETTEILFQESDDEFKTKILGIDFQATISIRKLNIELRKKNNSDIIELEILDKTLSNNEIEVINIFLYSSVLSFLSIYPISSTYILPVERNSIFTFSKELSIRKQEAVDHFHAMTGKDKIDKFELLFKSTTRYPIPIKEGLMIADDLVEIKKNTSLFYEFANEIENELFHGKLQITGDGELQFKPDKAPKKLLPIHMSASIIKTLSSLVIYLKHLAQKNDLIIIDEPEINLHPDNQIILTRLFARLINKGFRLLISTHSDYIIREFNNLIMLSSQKIEVQELSTKLGYTKDEFINKEDIGAYYFNFPNKQRGNKQLIVEDMLITNSGFEIPSVDEAIDNQNNISEELFYALEYAGNDE